MLLCLATSLLSLSPACAAPAQETSIFGEPVVVNGRRIRDDEIKRFLCHGLGARDMDMFKFTVMVDQELLKRRQDGASDGDLAKFVVTDEELERRIAREREDFLLRYPTLDFATEVARAEQSLDLFRERLRATMRFDKVFRPDDPAEWPEITRAIIIEQLGEQWLTDEEVSYTTRLRRLFEAQKEWLAQNGHDAVLTLLGDLDSQDRLQGHIDTAMTTQAMRTNEAKMALAGLKAVGLGDIPADDPIAVETTRGTVLTALNSYAIQHMDPDAIAAALPALGADAPADPAALAAANEARAANVLLTIEGVLVMIAQVWDRVAPYASPELVEDAKRFLVLQELLEQDLAANELLMSRAAFRDWWPTTARNGAKYPYMEYLQQHEMLSSQVLGFPSLWAFANYIRVEESYRKSIAEELAKDDLLSPSLPTINQIAGASRLSVNIILLSAYDFDHVKWKEGGWENAKKKALEIKKSLDEGAEWQPTLELHSEFWDPPMPEYGNKPMQNFYFKGTFGNQPQTRNQLMGYLNESEYRMFLYGPLLTDHIFFEQKMGSIAGPFRGPKGYYISRITGKTPPTRPLDLKEPVHREIVVHYYLKNSMNARAARLLEEGLAAGKVTGVSKVGTIHDL